MKKYNNRETAPLTYHSLFLYIGLPFSILTNALATYNNLTLLSYRTELFIYNLLDFIFTFALTILCCVTFWGLRKWKTYSWYTIYALISTLSLYSILVICLYAGLGIADFSEYVEPLGKIVFSIIIAIYYWKRKGLFFNPVTNPTEAIIPETDNKNEEPTETEETNSITDEAMPASKENVTTEDNLIIETYPPAETKPAEKKKKPVALIVCAIALICSLIGNVYLYSQNAEIAHEAQLWSDMLDETQDDRRELLEWKYKAEAELDFYDRYAVIVSEYNNKYHKYDCELWDYPIWIYNIDAAKDYGYTPCSRCFSD